MFLINPNASRFIDLRQSDIIPKADITDRQARNLTIATSEHIKDEAKVYVGRHSGALHVLFYLGLTLFVCHELDAVGRHEWRLLPGLNLLNDGIAQITFILIHIPLFAALFWLVGHKSDIIRKRSHLGFDFFLIVHAAAHLLMSGHELYEFEPPVETVTVYGGALVGLLHMVLCFRQKEVKT